MANIYWRAMQIMEKNRKRWLKLNPDLPERSGIYILWRIDENGIKYAYIGQAKKILSRLAQHLSQYQHIDLSLKKHGLFSEINTHGWRVDFAEFREDRLDEAERAYIKVYAEKGYQLRNKTSGGQDSGKIGIDDNKPSKGYRDGLEQGRRNALKEVNEFFEKYLDFVVKEPSLTKDGKRVKLKLKKIREFCDLINSSEKAELIQLTGKDDLSPIEKKRLDYLLYKYGGEIEWR